MESLIERVDAAAWRFVRRMALRWARKLVDAVDDRLHATEVAFRQEIAAARSVRPSLDVLGRQEATGHRPAGVGGEMARSAAPPAIRRRRRRMTAAAFDRRFA